MNALYAKAKKAFLDKEIDLLDDDIRAILVDLADYTLDLESHGFLSDIPVGAIVSTTGNLTGKSTTGGVFDADDVIFPTVSGDECEAIILIKYTGVSATSNLIAYIDEAFGLPVTPDGEDIQIQWDSEIFTL
jgi:hypothetical protein